ncbi:gamma-glutamyl hydrolase-like [Clytia hemisphaerica]
MSYNHKTQNTMEYCNLLIIWFIQVFTFVSGLRAENNGGIFRNEKPVIGIPAMFITDPTYHEKFPRFVNRSYIAASYVKYLESGGTRVVSIPPGLNVEEEKKIFDNINGLLFPGGEVNLVDSEYYYLTKRLFNLAKKSNDQGKHFPILGICRGMQAMIVHTVGNLTPLSLTDARNLPASLEFTQAAIRSVLLNEIPEKLLEEHRTRNLTAHFHKYGIEPKTFQSMRKIKDDFQIVATSSDRKGIEFVSIYEGKKYPFYGLQFHPEKIMYEWAEKLNVPRSLDAIKFSQLMVDNFIEEARKNTHQINSEIKEKYLMTKQQPIDTVFMEHSHSPFQQIYVY